MRNIKVKKSIHGSASVKFVLLVLLLAGLGIAVEYRIGTPGSTIFDRMRARSVVVDMDSLKGESQLSIKQTYHHLFYTCAVEHGILGDSVCWATISKFNGIDARLIAFFFRNDKLSAVRISFPEQSHPKVFSLMQKRYGPEHQFGQRTDPFGNNIVGWIRPTGIVAINDRIEGNDEPFLLWISAGKMLNKVFGIKE